MQCDLCGAEKELFKAAIENTTLNVCSDCSQFGKVMNIKEISNQSFKPTVIKENQERVVENYGELIKRSRESKGLKQKELAERLAEKESTIHKLETGHLRPSMKLARKLERFLEVQLIKEFEEKPVILEKSESGSLTIADLMKKK